MKHVFASVVPRLRGLSVLVLSFAAPLTGSVILQTFTLDDIFDDSVEYRPEQPPEPGAGFLSLLEITNFEKFNPALGTLNQIVFRLGIDFSFLAGVELIERQEDFFSMDVSFSAPAEAGLFYSQAPFLHALALLELDMDISFSVGLSGEPDSYYLFPSEFSSSDTGDITFADMMLASFYTAPDFIGTGFVENLSLGIGMPAAADVFSVTGDADNIRLFYGFEIAPTLELIMEYHYTPIPEPRATGLFAGLLVGCAVLVRRRRRALPAVSVRG